MGKIENMSQLRSEIATLRVKSADQEKHIRQTAGVLREELRPVNLMWSALSSLTGIHFKDGNPLREGIFKGVSSFFQRIILKTEKNLEEKAYDVVDRLFDKMGDFVNNMTDAKSRREQRQEDRGKRE